MPIDVQGERYFTATEAAKYLKISRESFYANVKDDLQAYTFGMLRRTYYRETDLDRLKRPGRR